MCRIERLLRTVALLACAATGAAAVAAERIVDWPARGGAGGWAMEKGGNAREATLGAGRGAEAAAEARFSTSDGKAPQGSLRFPVPFVPGRDYRISVDIAAGESVAADVIVRRRGSPYDPMAARSVTLGPQWQTVSFEASWPWNGAREGDVRVRLRDPQGSVRLRRLVVEDLGQTPLGSLPRTPFPATLFGLHLNKLGEHSVWPPAGQALIRLWDTRTTWKDLAPTPEAWDDPQNPALKKLDGIVDWTLRQSPGAVLLMTLGQPPRWASAEPDRTDCAYGTGTCGGPASMTQWRDYVRRLAQRYKGRIRHWELWNEADYRRFYSGGIPLVELARTARDELKAVDPGNLLLSPGFTASTGLDWLQNFLRDGGGRYVDIVGFHWYYDGQPEHLVPQIRNVRRVMAQFGAGDKPIWNTEGAPWCQGREAGQCVLNGLTPAEQDGVTPRALLTMWLNGVEGHAYYTAEGAGGRSLYLLAPPDWREPTSTARSLQTFAGWIVGARATALEPLGDGGHALGIERNGRRCRIAWREHGQADVALPAEWKVRTAEVLGERAAPLADGRLALGTLPVLLCAAGS